MEYYSAIKKNDIMPFAATWMELENLILSEMSQKDKGKYQMQILRIHCDFSFFIYNFGYLGSFSPLFSESGQGFVNFVHLFKEPALGFINFLYCFLSLYLIDFFFDLYNFLPSADFRTFLLFFF